MNSIKNITPSKLLLLCFCSLLVFQLNAQKKINKSFSFTNGVYTNHQEFKNNKPGYPLFKIPDFDYMMDGEQNLLFLSENSMSRLASSEIKSIDNIWGLSIKGMPYIKVKADNQKGVIYFVRLYIIGRINYFYYPAITDKEVEMEVYSPFTGAKVAQKTVTNRERTLVKKIMLFDSGVVKDYNVKNFKEWIGDDERLLKTLEDMSVEDIESKLFKTLKIYNDRHPVIIEG